VGGRKKDKKAVVGLIPFEGWGIKENSLNPQITDSPVEDL
jgi:hypothetical protein